MLSEPADGRTVDGAADDRFRRPCGDRQRALVDGTHLRIQTDKAIRVHPGRADRHSRRATGRCSTEDAANRAATAPIRSAPFARRSLCMISMNPASTFIAAAIAPGSSGTWAGASRSDVPFTPSRARLKRWCWVPASRWTSTGMPARASQCCTMKRSTGKPTAHGAVASRRKPDELRRLKLRRPSGEITDETVLLLDDLAALVRGRRGAPGYPDPARPQGGRRRRSTGTLPSRRFAAGA